jgi:hypothetical protein
MNLRRTDDTQEKDLSNITIFIYRHWKTVAIIVGFLGMYIRVSSAFTYKNDQIKYAFDCAQKQEIINKKRDEQIAAIQSNLFELKTITENSQKSLEMLVRMHMKDRG